MPKFLIVGRKGTGKDYLKNILISQYNWKFVKSISTRPKRISDEDTHEFVTPEQAAVIPENEKFAKTIHNGYEYFATKEQVQKADGYIVDPRGVRALLVNMPDTKFIVIYIIAEYNQRRQKAIERVSEELQERETAIIDACNTDEDAMFSEFEEQLGTLQEEYSNVCGVLKVYNDYSLNKARETAARLDLKRRKSVQQLNRAQSIS